MKECVCHVMQFCCIYLGVRMYAYIICICTDIFAYLSVSVCVYVFLCFFGTTVW